MSSRAGNKIRSLSFLRGWLDPRMNSGLACFQTSPQRHGWNEQCLTGIYGVDAESTFSLFHSLIPHSSRLIETFQDCRSASGEMGEQSNSSAVICCFSSQPLGMAPNPHPVHICTVFPHVEKIDMVFVNYRENESERHSYRPACFTLCRPNEHHFVLICSGKNWILVHHSRHYG